MLRHRIILDGPATNPRDAFLLGNGRFGAVAHGGIGAETFDLSLDTLWSGGPVPQAADDGHPDTAMLLPSLRAAIASGDLALAGEIVDRMSVTPAVQTSQPIGTLRWEYATSLRTRGYSRELDTQTATMATTVRGNELRTFVSAPADVLVAEWNGAAGALNVPNLRSPHHGSVRTWREGEVLWFVFSARVPVDARAGEPVRYGTEAPGPGGSVPAGMAFAVAAAVQPVATGSRLVVAAESGFIAWNRRPSGDTSTAEHIARYRVRSALSRSTDELHAEHVADYRALFDRSDLDLSESWRGAEDELAFHLGKYLLISASRAGSQPVHAQGLWNAHARPAGEAYRADMSLQMSYWAAERLGLPECTAPLRRMTTELTQTGRDHAWRDFGFSGAVAFESIDLWRASSTRLSDTGRAYWLGALPSLAAGLHEHALFTGDTANALSVHRVAARFALDLLVSGPDGDLVASPSATPGGRSGADPGGVVVAAGSTIDREIIVEVFEHYLALVGDQPRGTDVALVGQVRSALTHLAPVPVADGVITEWGERLTGGRDGSGALSHLYGLFPGRRINHTGPEMLDAARATLQRAIERGAGRTAAGQAWILAMAARLGDGPLAGRSLERLTGPLSSSSLLALGRGSQTPGTVIQLPASLALPGALAEMLVGYDAGAIRLLAALPDRWPKGTARGLRTVGGHRVDVTWDEGQLTSARIRPNFGCRMQVEAENGRFTITDDAGAAVQFAQVTAWNRNRNLLSFQVDDDHSYLITREGRARRGELAAGAPAVSLGPGLSMTLSGLPTV